MVDTGRGWLSIVCNIPFCIRPALCGTRITRMIIIAGGAVQMALLRPTEKRRNTIKIAGEIPEEKYGFRPAEGCRSIAETLVHIAVMSRVAEQIHVVEHRSTLVGFDFFGFRDKLQAEVKAPRTKAQIMELLRTEGEKYAKVLE